MSARELGELAAALRKAKAELHEASARVPKLREFDLFAFRSEVTIAHEQLLEQLDLLSADELLALLEQIEPHAPLARALSPADWMVWSYEHDAWWAPHERGYVKRLEYAGRYTRDRALEIQEGANRHRPADAPNERAMSIDEARTFDPARGSRAAGTHS